MPKETYQIIIYRPYDCSIGLTKQYIDEAINHSKGRFEPDDERMGIECLNISKYKERK